MSNESRRIRTSASAPEVSDTVLKSVRDALVIIAGVELKVCKLGSNKSQEAAA